MKRFYVYIVECSDGSYYTGVTNNIERRVHEHNSGLNDTSYTFCRRPVKLVFTYLFNDPVEAIRFEKQIKGWSRKKKKALIDNKWDLLPGLSKNNRAKKNSKIEPTDASASSA